MNDRNAEVSQALRDLADVFESVETGRIEPVVMHARPVADDLLELERVAVEVDVRIPFLDGAVGGPESETTLTPTDVRVQPDGTLRVDVLAVAGRNDDADPSARPSESVEVQTTSDRTTATVKSDETGDACLDAEVVDDDASGSGEGDETASDAEGDLPAENGSNDGDADEPAYRDPDKLRAVYEEYDTFAEMTEALGVDVTPQTVRRYMIKHRIHEPLSSTGSRTVATLVDADPDDIVLTEDAAPSPQSGTATEPAVGESEEQVQDTAGVAPE